MLNLILQACYIIQPLQALFQCKDPSTFHHVLCPLLEYLKMILVAHEITTIFCQVTRVQSTY